MARQEDECPQCGYTRKLKINGREINRHTWHKHGIPPDEQCYCKNKPTKQRRGDHDGIAEEFGKAMFS